MSPNSPSSTGSPNVPHSPDQQFRVIRKRNRIPLSCGPCRSRKLKCNRNSPCDNCIKRADVGACTYAAPAARKKSSISSTTTSPPDEMQNRIDRLENLVLSLMTNGPQAAGPAAAAAALAQTGSAATASSVSGSSGFPVDTEDTNHDDMDFDDGDTEVNDVAKSIGFMKVDGAKSMYISEAHWFTILAEISEVKNFFNDNKSMYEDQYKRLAARDSNIAGHGIFFLTYPQATRAEILRSFPPRGTTDVLIGRFFDIYNQDPPLQIIHGPTYQKQYDQHWANPQESDVIWLGLTYAMMQIAIVSFQQSGDEPTEYRGRTEQMYRDYKRLTAQCLMLADFSKNAPYMMESFIFYLLADLGKNKEMDQNAMVGIAILVRQAMKMGYHRDSKYFPGLSPFQGEMRRRVWIMIKHLDLRASSNLGLPPLVRSDQVNTELPRNLYDDELDENMSELPAPRLLSENTPLSFQLYTALVLNIGYEILEQTQSLTLPSYDKAMDLDRKLRAVRENIPPQFKFKPVEESLRDPCDIIMKRYILEIMYLKYLLLIHRKFCSNTRYPYSARMGTKSAMEILQHQLSLFNECRAGRRLGESKMFATSLNSQEFILAAMLVSMSLYRSIDDERSGRSPSDPFERNTRPALIAAMEASHKIWEVSKDDNMESFKAWGLLSAMLSALKPYELSKQTSATSQSSPFGNSPFTPPSDDVNKLAPEHSAAMTLNMLSAGASNANASLFGTNSSTTSPAQYDSAPSIATQQGAVAGSVGSYPLATDPSGIAAVGGPFSSLFGSNNTFPAFQQVDMSNSLDWDAWDSYMSNNTLDGGMMANIWPMNLDPSLDASASAPGPVTSQMATSGPPAQAIGGSGPFVPQFGR